MLCLFGMVCAVTPTPKTISTSNSTKKPTPMTASTTLMTRYCSIDPAQMCFSTNYGGSSTWFSCTSAIQWDGLVTISQSELLIQQACAAQSCLYNNLCHYCSPKYIPHQSTFGEFPTSTSDDGCPRITC
jgi:hypothetical protein